MDSLTPEERSRRMSKVRCKDTTPELIVRRLVHSLGYRYRLHGKDLPGRPDLVFRERKKVIFVHGCFWHRHKGCARTRTPKTRKKFWMNKFQSNRRRDIEVKKRLTRMGWKYLIVWECETDDLDKVGNKVVSFLEDAQ